MRARIAGALLALSLGGPAAAEPVLGLWRTEPGDDGAFAHVRIYQCGAAICGAIARAFGPSGAPVASDTVGKRMIWAMEPEGGGRYAGGRIWAPDRDRVYRARMALSGDRLEVSGCVGPFCRGQTWRRVE
jgi:uncharacterized protein (DUF2147 family)